MLISGSLKAAGGAGSVFSTILSSIGIGATTAAGGVSMLNVALAATVAGAVVLGITAIAGALIALGNSAKHAAENTSKLSETLSGARGQSDSIQKSIGDVQKLANSFTGAEKDIEAFNNVRAEIISKYPMLENVLSGEATSVGELAGKYVELIARLKTYNDMNAKTAWREAHANINDVEATYNNAAAKYNQLSSTGDPDRITRYFDTYGRVGKQRWMNEVNALAQNGTIAQMEGRIRDVREHLKWLTEQANASQNGVTQALQDRIDFWTNYLYNDLIPGLDKIREDADKAIGESLSGIITDALNPAKYPNLGSDTLIDMVEAFMGLDWQHEGGNYFTVDEIRDRVAELVGEYQLAIQNAMTDVDNLKTLAMTNPDAAGSLIQSYLEADVEAMKAVGISDETIESILMPIYEQLGKKRDELLADFLGGETSGEGGSGDYESFDKKLERAYQYLEQMQTLRESIKEITAEGSLSKDIIDGLRQAFEDDDGSWVQSLIDAATENGEFSLEAFVQRLRDQLAKMEVDPENNALLKSLGLDLDVTDSAVSKALDKIAKAETVKELIDVWSALPEAVQRAIAASFPEIEKMITQTEAAATQASDSVDKALAKIQRGLDVYGLQQAGKVWEDLDSVMDDIADGGSKASKALSDVQGRIDDTAEAMGALEAAKNGSAEALQYLATMTGLTADSLRNDLTPAEYAVAEASLQTEASVEFLANMLYQAGAIQIDPSGNISALGSIETAAANAGMTVAEFAAALASLNGAYFQLQMNANGTAGRVVAKVNPVKWGSGASFKKAATKKKSSGGGGGKKSGGGGGGGSAKNAVSDLVESMLDEFDRVNALRDHRRELAQMGQSYHEARGEIQGVIAYLQLERDIVEEDTAALEAYVAQLEAQIEANRVIVTTEAAGSKAYNQAMIDLDKLQEEHQKYSKTLIQNRTDVENLTDAIKKQYDKIRQMEIDLRNTILEAIEDREAANERMLSGRIAMEEEIMDRIKKRYEAERDQIIETQNARKSALEDEIDQIDELLAQRKKLAEQDDKMKEIAELEAQIMRISADPTRQKEALQLRQKLAKLREDMAWDAADAEAQAQKDSIKKQITSIEDYIQYVQDYYEDLFKHPQKLIEEMQEILTWTDDQIIAWLKKNTENYYDQTEAVQRKMVNEWQETLDDMRDTIRTHWEEVETIIAGGADNIINFLTTYSQKYREAGKLQAEAYVDEWKQQLKDLENAYKQVNANIQSYDYVKTTKVDSGSGGGGGSSGGGSGGSGGASASVSAAAKGAVAGALASAKKEYRFGWRNASGVWTPALASTNIATALSNAKRAALAYWTSMGGPNMARVMEDINSATYNSLGNYLKKYKAGGMNTTTGLAWLDGTKSRPERILSSYQTELFEDMINTLHQIRSVSTGGIMSAPKLAAGSMLPNIDTINITVEQLNSDTDYDDAAERLVGAFYKKVARTRPVGGIQGW